MLPSCSIFSGAELTNVVVDSSVLSMKCSTVSVFEEFNDG